MPSGAVHASFHCAAGNVIPQIEHAYADAFTV